MQTSRSSISGSKMDALSPPPVSAEQNSSKIERRSAALPPVALLHRPLQQRVEPDQHVHRDVAELEQHLRLFLVGVDKRASNLFFEDFEILLVQGILEKF